MSKILDVWRGSYSLLSEQGLLVQIKIIKRENKNFCASSFLFFLFPPMTFCAKILLNVLACKCQLNIKVWKQRHDNTYALISSLILTRSIADLKNKKVSDVFVRPQTQGFLIIFCSVDLQKSKKIPWTPKVSLSTIGVPWIPVK